MSRLIDDNRALAARERELQGLLDKLEGSLKQGGESLALTARWHNEFSGVLSEVLTAQSLLIFETRAEVLTGLHAVQQEVNRPRSSLGALREELGELRREFVELRRVVGELRRSELGEEFYAYREEVCELRSALDSERLECASLEFKLDNLSVDFADLVEGLKDAGVLVLGRNKQGETLATGVPALVVEKNLNEGKEAGDE